MAPQAGFPLFLLDTVLLPGESTVLHVFEDRYKQLAARCLDDAHEFGFVYVADDVPSSVGCAARIDEVLERFDDGRLNILVVGVAPIRLLELEDRFSYPSAVVEPLADAVGPDGAEPALLANAREAFGTIVEAITDERPQPAEIAELGSYGMAGRLALDAADKQSLLESRDENARLTDLERILAAGAKSVAQARELARRAKTNGHGRYGPRE